MKTMKILVTDPLGQGGMSELKKERSLQVDERPAYAMAGFLILFHDFSFAWGLTTSDYMRELYDEGKGGMLNDFTQVGIYVRGATVPVLGKYFLMACGGTVVAAWLAHRYQDRIAAWWDRAVK